MHDFTLGFGHRIDGMIPDEQLKTVLTELDAYCARFEITAKETAVSTYVEKLPTEFQSFMVAKKVAGRSSGTMKQYAYHIGPFLYHMGKPVADITESDIILYLYALGKTRPTIGNHTIDHVRCILNSFFTWCFNGGYISTNPMAAIEPIKYEKKEFIPIGEESFERIRQSIDDIRDRAIFEVMYSSGCRVGEIVGLKISDIDLKSREINVLGKGNKHRTSFISVRAVVALKEYLAIRPQSDDDHLFLTKKKPYNGIKDSMIRAILKRYNCKMDVGGNLHPHRLRHQFATEWVNKGLPVTELQQILGHANLRTTQEYYELSKAKTKYDHLSYIA